MDCYPNIWYQEPGSNLQNPTLPPQLAPEDPTLPPPWKGVVDGFGRFYYWNTETHTTQLERPWVPSPYSYPAYSAGPSQPSPFGYSNHTFHSHYPHHSPTDQSTYSTFASFQPQIDGYSSTPTFQAPSTPIFVPQFANPQNPSQTAAPNPFHPSPVPAVNPSPQLLDDEALYTIIEELEKIRQSLSVTKNSDTSRKHDPVVVVPTGTTTSGSCAGLSNDPELNYERPCNQASQSQVTPTGPSEPLVIVSEQPKVSPASSKANNDHTAAVISGTTPASGHKLDHHLAGGNPVPSNLKVPIDTSSDTENGLAQLLQKTVDTTGEPAQLFVVTPIDINPSDSTTFHTFPPQPGGVPSMSLSSIMLNPLTNWNQPEVVNGFAMESATMAINDGEEVIHDNVMLVMQNEKIPAIETGFHGLSIDTHDMRYDKTIDLFVLPSSILPRGKEIQYVSVYPSDFKAIEFQGHVGLLDSTPCDSPDAGALKFTAAMGTEQVVSAISTLSIAALVCNNQCDIGTTAMSNVVIDCAQVPRSEITASYYECGLSYQPHSLIIVEIETLQLRALALDRLWDDSGGILEKDHTLEDHEQHAIMTQFPGLLSGGEIFSQILVLHLGVQAICWGQNLVEAPLAILVSPLALSTQASMNFPFEQFLLCHYPVSALMPHFGVANLQVILRSHLVALRKKFDYHLHIANLIESMRIDAHNLCFFVNCATYVLHCFGVTISLLLEVTAPLSIMAFVESHTSFVDVSIGTIDESCITIGGHFVAIATSFCSFGDAVYILYAWVHFAMSNSLQPEVRKYSTESLSLQSYCSTGNLDSWSLFVLALRTTIVTQSVVLLLFHILLYYTYDKKNTRKSALATAIVADVICCGNRLFICVSVAEMTLDPRAQYWTSPIWAKLDVNYVGSTVYSRDYRGSLLRKWGAMDVNACCFCASYLMQSENVDMTRLGITVGSASGYTTTTALAFQTIIHMVGYDSKCMVFLATTFLVSNSPFQAPVRKLFPLSSMAAVQILHSVLAHGSTGNYHCDVGVMLPNSTIQLVSLRCKKQCLEIWYGDENYCSQLSCYPSFLEFLITWSTESDFVAMDREALALVTHSLVSITIQSNAALLLVFLSAIIHYLVLEFAISSHLLHGLIQEDSRAFLKMKFTNCLLPNSNLDGTPKQPTVDAYMIQAFVRAISTFAKDNINLQFMLLVSRDECQAHGLVIFPLLYKLVIQGAIQRTWVLHVLRDYARSKSIIGTLVAMASFFADQPKLMHKTQVFRGENVREHALSIPQQKVAQVILFHLYVEEYLILLTGSPVGTTTYKLLTPSMVQEDMIEADFMLIIVQEMRMITAAVTWDDFLLHECVRHEGTPYSKGGGMLGLIESLLFT